MTPQQWARVKEIFNAALERSPEKRSEFLVEACEGDESLREEVHRLLAEHDRAGEFLNSPTWPKGDPAPTTESDGPNAEQVIAGPGSPLAPLKAGETFANRYEIKGELGRGGFGVVYLAFDRGPLQRTVALKVIRLASDKPSEPTALARQHFLEEARVAGNLSHSNIATVFDVGKSAGCIYMTQELAPGRDLRKILGEAGPLPLRRIVAIVRQICEGLAHAHARGIVHRDIKPGNIVVGGEDRVKVTDFGLAQPPQGEDSALNQAIAGTPGYMAPEQLSGGRVDGRADIFAVGCVLYQMLTGRQPFEGSTTASVIEKTLHALPPEPSRVREDLPRTLDRIVARAMRKDPDERYNNITQLQQDVVNHDQFEYLTEAKAGAADIATALEARQCTLFLGLRLPVSLSEKHPPTAEALIAEYLAERLSSPPKERSLSRLAQHLELERGRPEMLKYLTAAVRNPQASPREMIRRLARLPFPVIVTTGYDTFLEEELAKVNRKVRRVINCRSVPDDPADADLLVRLFGSVDSETSIVVTQDDLWNFFGSFQLLSDALKSLFARHRLLFIGYDPEDEGFQHLFSEIVRFRVGSTEACYLAAPDMVLPAVRWAQRKALRLIDAEPASFLSLVEETTTERRRQKRSAKEEPSEAPLPSRPYKFLNYYDREDERIFFGRQSETNRLLTKIHAYPLNLLYAPSGSGKTSLICAGLMPQLWRQDYTPVYCRVYDDPAGEIRRAAMESVGAPPSDFPPAMPLQTLLTEVAGRNEQRLVIFVDQFEEIFIRHGQEARERFAASLAATLTEGKGRVRFVLSMREDFLARLSEFRERIPNIFHNEFRLEPLSEAESRAAIVEPAHLVGLEVEPELVERLIADLSREGVDPPQLQIVCDTLYDALEQGEKRLTLKSYLALGETRKILGNYLERVLHEFPPPEREAARELLKSLVTSEKTKTVVQIADLARAAGRPEDEASRILADLSNRRLIRRVQREEGYWYELTHEYLVEEISCWLSEKEMQIKKLRELLEQAIRNHRNLGMLMPAAQLHLVQEQEDDLHLSKEERQFLRESAQALSTRRRQMATVAVVAAVMLMGTVVAGRYLYLRSHTFIKPGDREFIEYGKGLGNNQSYRLEDIRLYSGSPNPWWIDRRLGFPKELYQSDFDLDQIDPSHRDTLKAGLMLSQGTSLEDQVFKMLKPDQQVRFLATMDKLNEGTELLEKFYNDPSVDQESLDGLELVLGDSGVSDPRFASDALKRAFGARVGVVEFEGVNLVPLLESLPASTWHDQIVPYLDNPARCIGALKLIGMLGTIQDGVFIKPYLASHGVESYDRVQNAAFEALLYLGDCSALESIPALIPPGRPVSSFAIMYMTSCASRNNLTLLEHTARREISAGPEGLYFLGDMTQAIYKIGGPSSIPTIASIVAGIPDSQWKVRAVRTIFDPEILPELRLALRVPQFGARSAAAAALAQRGDAAGLETAAEIAQDKKQETENRVSALSAFEWFRGPAIEGFLLTIGRAAGPGQAEVRAAVCRTLRWYDDADALGFLADGLKDGDRSVRDAAMGSLLFTGSERTRGFLKGKLKALEPVPQVYAARALQRMDPDTYSDVFEDFLKNRADKIKDYAATVQAIEGLHEAYLRQPVTGVVQALFDERREVRLAAILALAEHQDARKAKDLLLLSSSEADPYFRFAAARALWTLRAFEHANSIRARAELPLSQGDLGRARRILSRAYEVPNASYFQLDYRGVLKSALLVSKPFQTKSMVFVGGPPSYVFGEAFDSAIGQSSRFEWDILAREGAISFALAEMERLPLKNPSLRKSFQQDPNLASLRNIYEFRVLTGMQEPITVENIKLPQPNPPSPESAQPSR